MVDSNKNFNLTKYIFNKMILYIRGRRKGGGRRKAWVRFTEQLKWTTARMTSEENIYQNVLPCVSIIA